MAAEIAATQNGPIEYTLKGQGQVILVLHGMSQDCKGDAGYDAFIQSGFSMLTPSRPGYGRTPASVGQTPEAAATSMVGLLDALSVKKAHVMAISGGGPTGLYLAARHGDRVRRLALVSAMARPWQDKRRYEQVKRMYSSKSYAIMWSGLKVSSALFPRMTAKRTLALFSTHSPADFMRNLTREEIKELLRLYQSRASAAGALIDLKGPPDAPMLREIRIPTLISHSREDGSVDFGNAEYAADAIKGSELFVSPT